jgi:hypothetical protein
MTKILLASALLAVTTSAAMAQTYYGAPYNYGYAYGPPASPYWRQYYDYAPGYTSSGPGYYENDTTRGGPGPRVGGGSGMGIGAER